LVIYFCGVATFEAFEEEFLDLLFADFFFKEAECGADDFAVVSEVA